MKAASEIDLRSIPASEIDQSGKKIAYLHVGAHKTGTTSLQYLLRENSELLYRQGVLPLARTIPLLQSSPAPLNYNENFIRPLRRAVNHRSKNQKRKAVGSLRERLALWSSAAPRILISEEALTGRRLGITASLYPQAGRYMKTLSRILPEHQIRVILYVRKQDRFIESNYLHNVKLGDPRSFQEYFAALEVENLSWTKVVDAMAETVGHENIEVRTFESIREGFVPFARDFFELFSDPTPLELHSIEANPSLSGLGVNVARFLSPKVSEKTWALLRQPVQRLLSNRSLPAPALLTDEQRSSLQQMYADDYATVLNHGPRATSTHHT